MGYLRRHAIVVTGSDYMDAKEIKQAHEKASEIFPWVSPISPPMMNGEMSFFIPPDGSKEGWADSNEGDARRDLFIDWLKESYCADCWVEVSYGEDEPDTKVTRASDL